MLRLLAEGDVSVVNDQFGRPTLVDDLARGTMQAIDSGATGLLHLTNQGVTTWYGLACQIAETAGYDPRSVHPCTSVEYETAAPRPHNSVLDTERSKDFGLAALPVWTVSLGRAMAT